MSAPSLIEDTLEGRLAKEMSDALFVDKSVAEYFLKMLKKHRNAVIEEVLQIIDELKEKYCG